MMKGAGAMSKMNRYQALDKKGNVIASGKRLMDVTGAGERILIDYKKMRHAITGFYPTTVYAWRAGIRRVGDLLRKT
jgi:hypothetical protein